jgi:hypothetical protein
MATTLMSRSSALDMMTAQDGPRFGAGSELEPARWIAPGGFGTVCQDEDEDFDDDDVFGNDDFEEDEDYEDDEDFLDDEEEKVEGEEEFDDDDGDDDEL